MISWKKPGTLPQEHPAYSFTVLINVLLTSFLSILATVATIIADNNIQGALALSNPQAAWLTTLNLLGVNTTVPTASWFADRFGNKTMYTIGVALFTVATLIAGCATNFATIGIARVIEGIGSGFIFPVGLATIVQNTPPKRLSLALILYITAIFGGGFAIGLPLAGYLTQFFSWRWIFYLIVPFSLAGLISCSLIHEESERKTTSKFDYWGFLFFASFFGLLLVALTYGPMLSTNEGWRSPFILTCFGLSAICFIATIYIEMHREDPLIPLVLFKNPTYAVTCAAMFLLGMSIFASASTMIQYMITALSYERFVVGKIGMVYGIALAVFSIVANLLIKKLPVPLVTFLGLSILVFSYFLNTILDWQTGPDQIIPILCLRGIGLGLALGPATIQAMRQVPKEMTNKGSTFLTFFRQVGGTYGGTLIAIIVIKRKIFHVARFAEQTNTELPGYQVTFQKLFSHYHSNIFDHGEESAALAKATIIRNIEIQAFILSINDALMVFGYITMVVTLALAYLNIQHWRKEKKSKLQESASPH